MNNEIDVAVIYARVANWNSLRYEQEYDHKLSVALLEEELEEYYEADTSVDQLDALCDLIYVAMGIIWKCKTPVKVMAYNADLAQEFLTGLLKTNSYDPIFFLSSTLAKFKYDNHPPANVAAIVVTTCFTQMTGMGFNLSESMNAMMIVCISNDTKSYKKTPAHIKANSGDKGSDYIPPEPRLQAIIDRMVKRHGS